MVYNLSLPNHLQFYFVSCILSPYAIITLKLLHYVGSDITGEVIEVGKGVQKFKPGDKVVALVSPFVSHHKHYYIVAPVHFKRILLGFNFS